VGSVTYQVLTEERERRWIKQAFRQYVPPAVVEEIGRALGVEYDDDEELQGGDEIAERDRHRWELDPGSSDDFDER